jgi:hypothetical protein
MLQTSVVIQTMFGFVVQLFFHERQVVLELHPSGITFFG